MHVLMLSPDRLTRSVGGLGVHLRHVLAELASSRPDLTFDVVTWDEDERDERILSNTWERRLKPMVENVAGCSLASNVVLRNQARMLHRAMSLPRKPSIVHAHDWSTFDAARMVADLHGVPLATCLHLSVEDIWVRHRDEQPAIFEQALSMQYGGLACSTVTGMVSNHYMREYRIACPGQTSVVGNGVDRESFSGPRFTFPMPGTRPVKVCYIGRFGEMKNVVNLMKAPLPSFVDLVIAGGTDSGPIGVSRELKALSGEQRHLLGPLHGEEKLSFMRSANVAVFPSTREPFGIVGLEWMSARVPLVASFAGGMNDYLDDNVAVRCGTSPEEIGEAIDRASRMGGEEREAMVDAAYRRAGAFTWDLVARRYEELYANAVASRTVPALAGSARPAHSQPVVLDGSLRGGHGPEARSARPAP